MRTNLEHQKIQTHKTLKYIYYFDRSADYECDALPAELKRPRETPQRIDDAAAEIKVGFNARARRDSDRRPAHSSASAPASINPVAGSGTLVLEPPPGVVSPPGGTSGG